MRQLIAKITENSRVGPGFYKICIKSAYLSRNSRPGQFIEVLCSDGSEVFLRRPLGVHKITRVGIEMLYEVAGKGTELLSHKKKGGTLDVIGPLGNGFSIDHRPKIADQRPIVLVAGGIGVAPLVALAEKIVHGKEIIVLIGACKKAHILCDNDFRKIGAKVMVATEDGSMGRKGLITEALDDLLWSADCGPSTIYACGPTGMLRAVSSIASKYDIPCQVSLEEKMACGVGVCLGCPVKIKTQYPKPNTQYEYKVVCKDGPVFDSKEILW